MQVKLLHKKVMQVRVLKVRISLKPSSRLKQRLKELGRVTFHKIKRGLKRIDRHHSLVEGLRQRIQPVTLSSGRVTRKLKALINLRDNRRVLKGINLLIQIPTKSMLRPWCSYYLMSNLKAKYSPFSNSLKPIVTKK